MFYKYDMVYHRAEPRKFGIVQKNQARDSFLVAVKYDNGRMEWNDQTNICIVRKSFVPCRTVNETQMIRLGTMFLVQTRAGSIFEVRQTQKDEASFWYVASNIKHVFRKNGNGRGRSN